VLLSLATPGVDVASLQYASQAVGQLAPILLVAYLTTTLSADITEARERIENLAQIDSLTGLFNQRMFNEVWEREHAKCAGARTACTPF
jgi:predicted signal transduction protein with EAL and GGDEF domain